MGIHNTFARKEHPWVSLSARPYADCRDKGGMMVLRISILCHRLGIDADRAAMLAAFVWGGGHE